MTEGAERQPRGCFFYGAITVVLVVIGIAIGVYFGTRKAIRYTVETYTTNSPAPIPALEIPAPERKSIIDSLRREATKALKGRGEILLGEKELNLLIAESPDLAPYQKEIYLQPEGSQIRAYFSLPLDQFAPWKEFISHFGRDIGRGRYLNGTAWLNVSVTNAILRVLPSKVVVHATTLPPDFVARFPWDKLTERANQQAEVKAILERIESISVNDGTVHVRVRG